MKLVKTIVGSVLAITFFGLIDANAQRVIVHRLMRPAVVVVTSRPVIVARPVIVTSPVVVAPAPHVAVVARPRRIIMY